MTGVTGANGFVGRQLCLSLQRQGTPYRPVVRNVVQMLPAADDLVRLPSLDADTDWGPH